MIFSPGGLDGVYVVDLERRRDERGFFARAWCKHEFAERGLETDMIQVNVAVSAVAGTLRGMHYQQAPYQETKFVRCNRGSVFDVAVDLRPDSPTFRRWFGVELSAETGRALYVPKGCAHGYLTLSDDTELTYSTSAAYEPRAVAGVRHDDPVFSIGWPRDVKVISRQDRDWPGFLG